MDTSKDDYRVLKRQAKRDNWLASARLARRLAGLLAAGIVLVGGSAVLAYTGTVSAATALSADGVAALLLALIGYFSYRQLERALEAARLADAELARAQHQARLGNWELDLVRDRLFWSDEVFRIFEIDPAQFKASYTAFLAAVHPDDRNAVDEAYTTSLDTRQPYAIEHRLQFPDGRIKWVREACETEFDRSGKPLHSYGTVQDVTEQMQIKEALQANKEKLIAAQYLARSGDFVWHVPTGHVTWSAGMRRLLKYSDDEPIDYDRVNQSIHHPDDLKRVTAWLEENMACGNETLSTNEYRLLCKDGDVIWVETNGSITYEDGAALEIFGACTDITARKLAGVEAAAKSELNSLILQSTSDGFILADAEGRVLNVNPAYCQMVGRSREELIGANIAQLEALLTPEQVVGKIEQMLRDGAARFQSRHRHRDGSLIDLDVSIFVTQPQGEAPLVSAFVRDISERERMVAALRESEERFSVITRQSPVGIFLDDAKGEVIYVNDRCIELVGVPAEMALGQQWEKYLHPDDHERVMRKWSSALQRGGAFRDEFRWLHEDGDLVWTRSHVKPVLDSQDQVVLFIGTLVDITEQKRAEAESGQLLATTRRLTRQLLDVQEQERKLLAATLHDDIGQALTAIKAHASSIALHGQRQEFDQVRQSAEEVQAITSELLARVRGQLRDLRPGYVLELGLKAALEHLCSDWERGGAFTSVVAIAESVNDLPLDLQVSVFRIVQEALTNVAKHAAASSVSVGMVQLAYGLELNIKDNGRGFDVAGATDGMGIVGMRERVMALDGSFNLHSSVGEGAHIQVYLPVVHSD